MVVMKDSGVEVVPGITIPWGWFDGIICGVIESGEAGINAAAVVAVTKLDDALQKIVDNNDFRFDNLGKEKLEAAFTLAMVRRFMPDLLPSP